MGQQEIINLLVKRKRPMSLRDISGELGINRSSVSRACRQLNRNKEIKVMKRREKSVIRHLISI